MLAHMSIGEVRLAGQLIVRSALRLICEFISKSHDTNAVILLVKVGEAIQHILLLELKIEII